MHLLTLYNAKLVFLFRYQMLEKVKIQSKRQYLDV